MALNIGMGLLLDQMTKGVAAPFVDPSSLPNLQLWYDAQDAASITSAANAVSQINDKSGNARHGTQGVGASQPTTGTRTLNTKNVLNFDGVDDSLGISNSGFGPYASVTIFYVADVDDTATSKSMFASGSGAMSLLANATEQISFGRQQQITIGSGGAGFTNGIIAINGAPSGSAMWYSGVNQFTNAVAPAPTITTTAIGVQQGTNRFDGGIGEVIVYDRVLSQSEMNLVGNYLSTKWGISWTNI